MSAPLCPLCATTLLQSPSPSQTSPPAQAIAVPCGHVFCQACLDARAHPPAGNALAATVQRCPTCDKPFLVPTTFLHAPVAGLAAGVAAPHPAIRLLLAMQDSGDRTHIVGAMRAGTPDSVDAMDMEDRDDGGQLNGSSSARVAETTRLRAYCRVLEADAAGMRERIRELETDAMEVANFAYVSRVQADRLRQHNTELIREIAHLRGESVPDVLPVDDMDDEDDVSSECSE